MCAQEAKRGCGFRKHGGIYLVGGGFSMSCDRLPFPIGPCRTCGGGVHFTRGMTEINPLHLFGEHGEECADPQRPNCFVCQPKDELAYVMMVGEKFYKTPEDFNREANLLGISKRIGLIPKKLELGKTVIFLAHMRACEVPETPAVVEEAESLINGQDSQVHLLETPPIKRVMGIFRAFIPQKIEKIFWKHELTDEVLKDCEKKGITPVGLDIDEDHLGRGEEV